MLIGTVQQPITFTLGTAQIFEIDFQSSFVYLQEEVEMYLQMLAAGKIAFPGMVTDIVSLDNCQEQGLGRKDRASQLKNPYCTRQIIDTQWDNVHNHSEISTSLH